MIIFVLILLMIIFVGIDSAGKNEFYNSYCSPKQTTCINGICVLLVFISHAAKYLELKGTFDAPYATLKANLGQLVVVTFLFYSGYGMTESIKKKGFDYVKGIPTKRLFRVWYHFAIALVLYVILCLCMGKQRPLSRYLLAFTGWSSIINSNWYMLTTFVLYIAMFIGFVIFRKSKLLAAFMTTALIIGFAYFEYKVGQPGYYYNTVICFPAGMFFSLLKPYFDKFFLKNDVIWILGTGLVFGLVFYLNTVRNDSVVFYSLWALFAAFLVLFITMKVKIQNSILDWFGHRVFSIYMLHHIPLEILKQFNLNKTHPYAFVMLAFVATIALATLFDAAMEKTDALIYSRKKKEVAAAEMQAPSNA